MDRVGGRKMVLSLVVLSVGLAVDLTAGLSDNMLKLMMLSLTAFVLGNVGEHCFAAMRKRRTSASTQAITQVNQVVTELDTIRDDVKAGAAVNQTVLDMITELSQKEITVKPELPKDLKTQLQASNNQAALISQGMTALLTKVDQVLQLASATR